MKQIAFALLLIFFSACNTSQQTIDAFWADFQQAVLQDDREAVADLTTFPLMGAEGYTESADTLGISRAQFLQQFDYIFDEKVKATIAKTAVRDLQQYVSPKDAALESMSLPPNTVIYYLNVLYVFDEGLETQTESSVGFYFLKDKGVFKLAYVAMAG